MLTSGNVARNHWKPPPGFVSAKAKAYATWKEHNGKQSKKDNMLTADEAADTDDTSSDEESGFRLCSVKSNRPQEPKKAPPPSPVATQNSFEAFDNDDIADDGVAALGDCAHNATVGKQGPSQYRRG